MDLRSITMKVLNSYDIKKVKIHQIDIKFSNFGGLIWTYGKYGKKWFLPKIHHFGLIWIRSKIVPNDENIG